MTNQLKQIIDNYIDSDEPNALQIDGEWGTGKTYYIKENVIPELLRKKYYPVYFSVYGYNDLSEIKQSLIYKIISVSSDNQLLSSYQSLKEKFQGVSSALGEGRIKSAGLIVDWLAEAYQNKIYDGELDNINIIIFLDDLERVSKSIHTKDLLGFVLNELLEKLKCKVIIISNSNEIEKSEDFNKIKEKVINRTVEFSYDLQTIGLLILKKSKNKFIKEQQVWILNIIDYYLSNEEKTGINLRMLFSVIANYDFIEKRLHTKISEIETDEHKLKIKKSIFLNVFVITNEYKIGKVTKDNYKLLSRLNNTKFFEDHLSNEKENTISDYIVDKYHKKNNEFDNYIMYSEVINNYVLFGFLNDNDYVGKWKNVFNITQAEISNLDKLFDFRRYSDDELQSIQREIIRSIENNYFEFDELLKVYNRMLQFDSMDLIFVDKDYNKKIEDKLIKQYKEIDTPKNLDSMLFMTGLSSMKDEISDLIKEFKRINTSIELNQSMELVKAIFENDYRKTNKMKEHLLSNKSNIFKTILDKDLLDVYIIVKNNVADYLDFYIRSEYLRIKNANQFHEHELPDIKELLKQIDIKLPAQSMGRIDTFKIIQLKETLEKLIPHLSHE